MGSAGAQAYDSGAAARGPAGAAERASATDSSAASAAQQQAQPQPPKAKPEPIQNVAERAACLNKDTPQAALIAACTVVIEAGKDKPAALATMYFNRGDAYREKGDLDNAIKDLGESHQSRQQERRGLFQPRHRAARQGRSRQRLADFDQAIKARSAQPGVLFHPQPRAIMKSATTSAPSPT